MKTLWVVTRKKPGWRECLSGHPWTWIVMAESEAEAMCLAKTLGLNPEKYGFIARRTGRVYGPF